MTICVAAICDGNSIIGASDRMLTSGDVLFQPALAKTRTLTSSIVAMISGDAALHAEVLARLQGEVNAHIQDAPQDWLSVQWAADRYVTHWSDIRRERAERAILWPLGLTVDDYLDRQSTLTEKLVGDIADGMMRYYMPVANAIIAGVDYTGPHLFHVENGVAQCMDSIGFAYIGSGGRHAASQLMLDGYSPLKPLPESLLLVHSAKRRAEVAPGVGLHTDLWFIGSTLGSFTAVSEEILARLDKQFEKMKRAEDAALQRAKIAIQSYLDDLVGASDGAKQEVLPANATA